MRLIPNYGLIATLVAVSFAQLAGCFSPDGVKEFNNVKGVQANKEYSSLPNRSTSLPAPVFGPGGNVAPGPPIHLTSSVTPLINPPRFKILDDCPYPIPSHTSPYFYQQVDGPIGELHPDNDNPYGPAGMNLIGVVRTCGGYIPFKYLYYYS